MTRLVLLEQLKERTGEAIGELMLPVRPQSEQDKPALRAAEVHLMRLPDSRAAKKKAPYIIHQAITGQDSQTAGQMPEATATVRSVFCVYDNDEERGAVSLLNLMERLRVDLLKFPVVGDQFRLDLSQGLETLIYPEDSAPYYMGEMVSVWKLPTIRREDDIHVCYQKH